MQENPPLIDLSDPTKMFALIALAVLFAWGIYRAGKMAGELEFRRRAEKEKAKPPELPPEPPKT